MKKLRLKKSIKNKIPLAFFYITIVAMILIVNTRFNDFDKKSATESEVQIAQIHHVK